MWSFLVEPFVDFAFMRGALLEAILLGVSFSALGVALISRRLALIGDTMSHAMLPGVVGASLLFGPRLEALVIGGGLMTFILVFLASRWRRRPGFAADSALALFAVFSVAVGVLLASGTRSSTEVLHLLFGNILAVEPALLVASAIVCALTVGTAVIGFRGFTIALVDPAFFDTVTASKKLLRLWLLLLFAANLTLGFAALGAMMTVGLLIVPALAVRPFVGSLLSWIVATMLAAMLVSFIGVLLSFHGEWPSGPSIVVVACVFLALGSVIARWRSHGAV